MSGVDNGARVASERREGTRAGCRWPFSSGSPPPTPVHAGYLVHLACGEVHRSSFSSRCVLPSIDPRSVPLCLLHVRVSVDLIEEINIIVLSWTPCLG